MLHLIATPETPQPRTIEAIAERIALIAAPYPSERPHLAALLVEFAREIKRTAIEGD